MKVYYAVGKNDKIIFASFFKNAPEFGDNFPIESDLPPLSAFKLVNRFEGGSYQNPKADVIG